MENLKAKATLQKLSEIQVQEDSKREPYGIVLLLVLIYGVGFIFFTSSLISNLERWIDSFIGGHGRVGYDGLINPTIQLIIAAFCLLTIVYIFMRKKRSILTAHITVWIFFIYSLLSIIMGYNNLATGGMFFQEETVRAFSTAFRTIPSLIFAAGLSIGIMLFLGRSVRIREVLKR